MDHQIVYRVTVAKNFTDVDKIDKICVRNTKSKEFEVNLTTHNHKERSKDHTDVSATKWFSTYFH